jgi:hypothetical protein
MASTSMDTADACSVVSLTQVVYHKRAACCLLRQVWHLADGPADCHHKLQHLSCSTEAKAGSDAWLVMPQQVRRHLVHLRCIRPASACACVQDASSAPLLHGASRC